MSHPFASSHRTLRRSDVVFIPTATTRKRPHPPGNADAGATKPHARSGFRTRRVCKCARSGFRTRRGAKARGLDFAGPHARSGFRTRRGANARGLDFAGPHARSGFRTRRGANARAWVAFPIKGVQFGVYLVSNRERPLRFVPCISERTTGLLFQDSGKGPTQTLSLVQTYHLCATQR